MSKRICPECGVEFVSTHPGKTFCTPSHYRAFQSRMTSRGKVMAPLVMAWRKGRGQKGIAKKALAELCRIIDHYTAEDVAAGRPAIGGYVEGLLTSYHTRLLDR